MATCPGGHIDPKEWTKGRCKDGTVNYYCKHCKKWIGSLPPTKEPK
jgi:hypothetical protein